MLMAKAHELHAAAEASDAEAAAMEAQDEELESQLADVESAFDEVEAKIDELEGLDSEDSDEEPAPERGSGRRGSEPAEAPVVEVSEPPTDTSDSEVTETEGDSDGDAVRTASGRSRHVRLTASINRGSPRRSGAPRSARTVFEILAVHTHRGCGRQRREFCRPLYDDHGTPATQPRRV